MAVVLKTVSSAASQILSIGFPFPKMHFFATASPIVSNLNIYLLYTYVVYNLISIFRFFLWWVHVTLHDVAQFFGSAHHYFCLVRKAAVSSALVLRTALCVVP